MLKLNDKFEPLFKGDTRYYIITGGRGSSKSFTVNTFLNLLTFDKGHRILFTRWTMASANISIIPEFLEKIELLGAEKHFKITLNEIKNIRTGSEILFRGIKTSQGTQTANLKSLVNITTWVIDEAEELADETIFDKINLSVRSQTQKNRIILILNPTHRQHWIYKRFFEKAGIKEGFNGQKGDVTYIHTTYLDNIENLPDDYLNEIYKIKENNPRKYKHQILGGWVEDVEGALWKYDLIEKWRVQEAPELIRIVVAIDPAVTSNKKSDETGIVIAGIDNKGHAYVLEDRSGRMTPNGWAREAIMGLDRHKGDRIIGEINNGGDLIETVLRDLDSAIPYKSVHASRGKVTRAEPVVALYEQGKVHHVGIMPALEEQMTTFTRDSDWSPDRMDALVWAITELLIAGSISEVFWR